jgi:hypothetical protein
MPTFAGRCAWWLLLLLAACGLPDRSNPADPRIGGNEGDGFQLLAEVPENHRSEIADRIAEVRYSISAVDMPKPIEGTMDLIGTSARARISGLTAGAERIFSILAVDESGIPTFAAIDTQDVDAESTEAISLQMHRLFGIVEIVSLLPPEIIALEVQIGTGADTLLRQFEVDGPLTRRIVDIPTGADVSVTLRGFDAETQVLLQDVLRADIREDLVAHLSIEIVGGSIRIVANFPTYLPVVEIDRFSDEMGSFFRRSDNPDLPAANEPIDFDQPQFLLRGSGPNGEAVTFYHFDVRPREPGIVYEFIDRRGERIAGQLPVFDRIPGEVGYSDFWQVQQVRVQDIEYRVNSLHAAADVLASGWEITALEEVSNYVLVPFGSRAVKRFDPATPTRALDGWYNGQIVKYLQFENPQSSAQVDFGSGQINTPQMYAFFDNNRDEKDGFALDPLSLATHNVVTRLPGEEGYSPLWVLQVFTLAAFDRVIDLASALDQAKNEENLIDLGQLIRINAPIVQVGSE